MNLQKMLLDIKIQNDLLQKVKKNRDENDIVINYFKRLKKKDFYFDESVIDNKIKNISSCNEYFDIDIYKKNKVKDLKRTNRCQNPFCSNCKKVKQALRMTKYIPELEKYKNNLYHMTLTQPNVTGENLKDEVKKMSEKSRMLIRYIRGEKKIKDLSFDDWGYLGAIRSLEITFVNNSYHPHYHCGIIFKDFDLGEKTIQNTYSKNRKNNDIKLFSEKEIMIQKIWYLLMNDIKVTKKAIDNLDLGYSCAIDKFKNNDYAELFKYMTKATTENNKLLSFNNFRTLYFSLHRMKQIQGYGVLWHVDDKDNESLENEVDKLYSELIEKLKEDEESISTHESLISLISDKKYIHISRKMIFKYLKDIL